MFLKGLEIFGFKSFADRTKIEFADGITALLGPNGCGKSNVVDAVKWVLGEQAAKTMRAEKMEDIIFNGTETRKPLNMAEVTLILANDNGLLPLDMSEISIKRRLYRSGEGEYFINNQQVKLREVRELFWDTGVGKVAYSVMEQGKIDQILSSKPEDRRYLFEEAAGITRFKAKRAEAERKLARTEENMKQVEGILGEVKRSYDTLKIQADKTSDYRILKDEIFEHELDIQLLRLKNFIQDKRNRDEDLKKLTAKRDGVQSEIDSINEALTAHIDEVSAMETKLVEMQQKIYGLAIEERSKSEQLRHFEETRSLAKEKLKQLEIKKTGLEERIDILTEDADEQEGALQELHRRLAEIAKNIASFEENITISGDRIIDNNKKIATHEDSIKELDVELENLQVTLVSITENIVTELDAKLKDAGFSAQGAQKAKEELSTLISQLKVLSSGRAKIFSDFAKVDTPSKNDIVRFTQSAVSSFTEIENLAKSIESAMGAYENASPSFISDFLSPEGIITKKRAIDKLIQDNRSTVSERREKISELKSHSADLNLKMEEYRATLENLRINQAQMKTQIQSSDDQIRILRRELANQEGALRELENELFAETKRFEEIDNQVLEVEGEIAVIKRQGIALTKELEELEKTITNRNSDVAGKRDALKSLVGNMQAHQEKIEKYHLDLATTDTEIRNLKENFKESHSRDLMEFEERMFTITVPAAQLREETSALRQKIKDLGNVNLMAVEEFTEAKERYDFLSSQIEDLKKARDDLHRITEEIRAESTELFLATYNKIKKNFHNMFRRLFGGGRAELRLVDPQNVLQSGVDIFAQPPGKKLENIALLSGGEKTMTAVALLFATYMVRPSPFCLLDEIDAALDDENVSRFINTLREFGSLSQYIVITHNKKTVAGANTLLGVTMEEFGVSKIITIRLESDGKGGGSLVLPDITPFEEEDVEPEQNVYIPPHPPKRNKKKNDEKENAVDENKPEIADEKTVEDRMPEDISEELQDENVDMLNGDIFHDEEHNDD